MDINKLLGIYPNAIEAAVKKCEELREGAMTVLERFDYKDDFETLNCFDLESEILEGLKEKLDIEDITNSVITASFEATKGAFESCQFFDELGLSIDTYVNCDDSHLSISSDSGIFTAVNDALDIENLVNNTIAEKLYDAISEYLQDETNGEIEYPLDYVQDDISDERIDYTEIAEFLSNGELSDSIKEMVKEEGVEVENNLDKETEFERD